MGPQNKHRTRWREEVSVAGLAGHFGKSLASSSLWFCTLVVWRFSLNFWFRWTKCPLAHLSVQLWLQEKLNQKFWSIYCKLLLTTVLEIASFRCKYIFSDQLFGSLSMARAYFPRIESPSQHAGFCRPTHRLSVVALPFLELPEIFEQICWWADEKWIILSHKYLVRIAKQLKFGGEVMWRCNEMRKASALMRGGRMDGFQRQPISRPTGWKGKKESSSSTVNLFLLIVFLDDAWQGWRKPWSCNELGFSVPRHLPFSPPKNQHNVGLGDVRTCLLQRRRLMSLHNYSR